MKKTIAFLGIGNRGYIYAKLAKKNKLNITSICDYNENSLNTTSDELDVPNNMRFINENEFFSKGKLAETLVICTPDVDHAKQCVKALGIGYNVILEKPIAINEKELIEVQKAQKKSNTKVVVCHVLRYTNFYRKIKDLINDDSIGKIIHFSQSENVGWWHYTQSYVRGKWRNSNTSSPMILAKCCHDFDIINWLLDDKCVSLSSFGRLSYFNKDNSPIDSSNFCFECKLQNDCLYSAINRSIEMPGTMNVPYGFGYTEEEIKNYLSCKNNSYARCVYNSDNNVVDHQTVSMIYKNGETASLNMHAFAQSTYRHTKITGTKGEIDSIFSDEGESYIKLSIFSPFKDFQPKIFKFKKQTSGHGGGDANFIKGAIDYIYRGIKSDNISELDVSLSSHFMAFSAEKSRLNEGKPEKV